MTGRELHWNKGASETQVRIEESGGHGIFHIGEQAIPFVVRGQGWLEVNGRNIRYYVHRDRNEYSIWIDGRTYRLTRIQKGAHALEQAGGASGEVRALMPGKVLRVEVAVGDTVKERQPVVIMESMKMESSLPAPKAGAVIAIECAPGQIVEMGTLLVTIE